MTLSSALEDRHSGKRLLDVLGKRLGRYGLTLHEAKTRYVDFRRRTALRASLDVADPIRRHHGQTRPFAVPVRAPPSAEEPSPTLSKRLGPPETT